MDVLYAPWRQNYVTDQTEKDKESNSSCVFCEKFSQQSSSSEFILKKTEHVVVVMNLYPYNAGHLLILPIQHVDRLSAVSQEVRKEMMEWVSAATDIVQEVLGAHGVNIGANISRFAGAGIPDHVHLHVVPRWQGDTNFLPVISKTKQISVDLEKIYNKLLPAFQNLEV